MTALCTMEPTLSVAKGLTQHQALNTLYLQDRCWMTVRRTCWGPLLHGCRSQAPVAGVPGR